MRCRDRLSFYAAFARFCWDTAWLPWKRELRLLLMDLREAADELERERRLDDRRRR